VELWGVEGTPNAVHNSSVRVYPIIVPERRKAKVCATIGEYVSLDVVHVNRWAPIGGSVVTADVPPFAMNKLQNGVVVQGFGVVNRRLHLVPCHQHGVMMAGAIRVKIEQLGGAVDWDEHIESIVPCVEGRKQGYDKLEKQYVVPSDRVVAHKLVFAFGEEDGGVVSEDGTLEDDDGDAEQDVRDSLQDVCGG